MLRFQNGYVMAASSLALYDLQARLLLLVFVILRISACYRRHLE
jgi:hypothetical protein